MANAGTVNVNLRLAYADFVEGTKRAGEALDEFTRVTEGAKHLVEAFLGYEALKGVAEWVHHTMEAIDAQAKFADRLGVSTEALTGLAHAGSLAGVTSESLNAAMSKMEVTLSGASLGTKNIAESLRQMGQTTADYLGLSPDQQFLKVAEGLQRLSTSGDRARVAVEIFGKAGADMLPLLNEGAEKIAEESKQAAELGIAFSRVDAAKVEAANDALTRVSATLKGGLNAAAISLSPLIEAIAGELTKAAVEAGGFGRIGVQAFEGVAYAVGVIADAWNVVKAGVAAVQVAWGVFSEGVLWVGERIARAVIGWGQLFNQFGDLVSATFHFVGSTITLVWTGITDGLSVMLAKAGSTLANFLSTTAQALPSAMAATAETLNTASLRVSTSIGTLAANSERAMDDAIAKSKTAAQAVKDAWSSFGTVNTDGNPIVKMFAAGAAAAHTYAEDSAVKFKTAFDSVINQTNSSAIAAWFAKIKQQAQVSAEQHAEIIKQRIAADQEAAQIQLSIDSDAAEKLIATLNKEVLAEQEQHTKRLEELKRFHAQGLLEDAQYNLLVEKENLRHTTALNSMDAAASAKNVAMWEEGARGKAQVINSILTNLAGLMQSKNKEMFEVGKAAALASCVVNTAEAAIKSYNAMADIPYVGPYLGAAAAAAAIAYGAIQFANISSASFEGGGSVGSGAASLAGISAAASAANPTTAAGVTGAGRQTIQVDVSGINDSGIYSGKFIRNLITAINKGQTDGSPIMATGVA